MKKPELRIFVTAMGRFVAGAVKKRESNRITLVGAAFVEIDASQARFLFTPIKFVTEVFILYQSGLLGETEMPKIMRAGFEAYLKTLSGNKAEKKRK